MVAYGFAQALAAESFILWVDGVCRTIGVQHDPASWRKSNAHLFQHDIVKQTQGLSVTVARQNLGSVSLEEKGDFMPGAHKGENWRRSQSSTP